MLAQWLARVDIGKAREIWSAASEELRYELVAGGFAPSDGSSDPFAPSGSLPDGFDGLESLLREKAESGGNPDEIKEFLNHCGADWAKRDLPGAFTWVQTHLHGARQVDKAAGLFRHAAAADFDAARAFWETLPPSTLRVHALQELVNGAPPERRKDVETLIKSLPPRDAARINKPGDHPADPFAPRASR
jgi:hypothetical protein